MYRFGILWIVALAVWVWIPAKVEGRILAAKDCAVQPKIISQRAIVIFKDGRERWIVEAGFEGKGREFGWIVPVPSKPTAVEETSPGFIKTLSLAIQPRIWTFVPAWRVFYGGIGFILVLWMVLILIFGPKGPLFDLLALFILFLFLLFMTPRVTFLPPFGIADVAADRAADGRQTGPLEISILEPNTPDALDQWLEANGLARLSDEDRPIVQDSISNGWCFVAARFSRDGEGLTRPHPLAITLPVSRSVFPLRWAAAIGERTYVEILVIADQRLDGIGLPTELAKRLWYSEDGFVEPVTEERVAGFFGSNDQRVGHPDSRVFLWNGCWMIKMKGDMDTGLQDQDLRFKPTDRQEEYLPHYYSPMGARQVASSFAVILSGLLAVLLTIISPAIVKGGYKRRHFAVGVVLPSMLIYLGVWSVEYLRLPKIEVRNQPRWHWEHKWYEDMGRRISQMKNQQGLQVLPLDRIDRSLRQAFQAEGLKNPVTGEPVRVEDSPGHYTLFEDDRGPVLRTYDIGGFPMDLVIRGQSK